MEQFIELIAGFVDFAYATAIVLGTFIVLYYFIKNTTKQERFLISAIIGIILGAVWYHWQDLALSKLIVSFFFATGFYKWIKEFILKKLKINYKKKS